MGRQHPFMAQTSQPRRPYRKGLPAKVRVDFTRSLATMVEAHLPVLQALQASRARCSHDGLNQLLGQICEDIQAGMSLSESISKHPRAFDRRYVHMVAVGEATGLLGEVLMRLATYLEQTERLKQKVHLAMLYPALLLGVATVATAFLLIVVVPRFAGMFADFGATLPPATRFVVVLGRSLTEHVTGLVVIGIGGAWGLRVLLQNPALRHRWDRWVLALPVMGNLQRMHLMAAFCRTLGTLLSSGVSVAEALQMLEQSTGNLYLGAQVANVADALRQGSTLADPLARSGLFPPMVVQMVAAGEQTATLDTLLLHVAGYYEAEVHALVESLTALMEPLLIVIVGLLLGGLVMALYLPVFSLLDVIG